MLPMLRAGMTRSRLMHWLLLAAISGQIATIYGASCAAVQREFSARRIGPLRLVPAVPKKPANLQVCPNARISCCTAAMERKYVQASRRDMEMMLDRNFRTLTIDFSTFVREFQGKVESIGVLSKLDAIAKLASAFPEQEDKKVVAEAVDSFIDNVIVAEDKPNWVDMKHEVGAALDRTFGALFAQTYKRDARKPLLSRAEADCVSRNYKYFEVFRKVSASAKERLLGAINETMAFYQAVLTGLDAVKSAEKSVNSRECREGIAKMQYCSHCYGLTLIRPCRGLCQNVVRGCLVGMSEMDLYWKHYVSALIITAKRASDNGSDVQSSLKSVVNDIATAIKVRLTKSTVRSVGKMCFSKTIGKRSLASTTKRKSSESRRGGSERRHQRRNRRLRNIDAAIRPRNVVNASPSQLGGRNRILPPFAVLRDSSVPISPPMISVNHSEITEEVEIDYVDMFGGGVDESLNAKMLRFANRLNASLFLYETLPDKLCGDDDDGFAVASRDDCWNGAKIVNRYTEPVPSKGLEGQLGNPEMQVTGIGSDAQNAVEHLRISSKILLLRNGYDSIPRALLHRAYFITKAAANTSRTPCDDEDDCADEGSAQMSGSEPEYDDDTPHAGSNLDNAVLVDDVDAGNGTGRHRVLSLLPADTSVRSALRQLRQPRRRSDDMTTITRFHENKLKPTSTPRTKKRTGKKSVTPQTSVEKSQINGMDLNILALSDRFFSHKKFRSQQLKDNLAMTVEVVTKTTTPANGGGRPASFDRNVWLRTVVLLVLVGFLRHRELLP